MSFLNAATVGRPGGDVPVAALPRPRAALSCATAWSARAFAARLLPMLLLCLEPAPALCADWRLAALRSTRYGISLSFVDLSSIVGGDGKVSFLASTYFSRKTGGMNRIDAHISARCGPLTYRFDQLVPFYNQRPLARWSLTATSTAAPGTNVFDEIAAVCGTRPLGAHVRSPEAFAAAYFVQIPSTRMGFTIGRSAN
jgi:hypothetical protein